MQLVVQISLIFLFNFWLSLTLIVATPQGYSSNGYPYSSRHRNNPWRRRPTTNSYNLDRRQPTFQRYSQPQQLRQGNGLNPYWTSFDTGRYYQDQPNYNSLNTYSSSSSPSYNGWKDYNSPSMSYQTLQPQSVYNYGGNYQDQGVVWSSQWTEWLPVSKVRWDLLRNRTYAKKVIDHIPPRAFNGLPTNEATETYQGIAKKYYTGIFPSIEDEKYTYNGADVAKMGGLISVYESNDILNTKGSCDKFCCYRKCRLDMIGGGRCTSAGCICYESFFIENDNNNETFGAPASIANPEDRIWYMLNYTQTEQIQTAMRHYRTNPKSHNYMCKKDLEQGGTAEEKKWIATYDKLDELDHLNELDKATRLLRLRHKLIVPGDLIQIAYDEVMDDSYYAKVKIQKLRQQKILQQRLKRRKLENEWFGQENWARYGIYRESFTDFVRRKLTLEENLVVCPTVLPCRGRLTFESVANFFEHREPLGSGWGVVKHPRTDERISINVYIMMKLYHAVIISKEHNIANRLNFIENDYCCKDITENSDNGGYNTINIDDYDVKWKAEDDTNSFDTDYFSETESEQWIDKSDNLWATTTPEPDVSTVDTWNSDTTEQPWNEDGSGEETDFDDEEDDDGFGFDEEDEDDFEENDDFGFDDDDDW